MILSKRLQILADNINETDKVIDVGCDHGKLSCYLLKNKQLKHVIASDIEAMPVQACKKTAIQYQLVNQLDIVQFAGLKALENGYYADTAVISGMGGYLISTILQAGPTTSLTKLVLQPNNGEYTLRKWLCENGYQIVNEYLLKDKKVIYEVIIAIVGEMKLDKQALMMGPLLLQEHSSLFEEKWVTELAKLKKLVKQIPKIEDQEPLLERIALIEDALKKATK